MPAPAREFLSQQKFGIINAIYLPGKDPEDAGVWTPVQYYSSTAYTSKDDALSAATRLVIWLAEKLRSHPAKT